MNQLCQWLKVLNTPVSASLFVCRFAVLLFLTLDFSVPIIYGVSSPNDASEISLMVDFAKRSHQDQVWRKGFETTTGAYLSVRYELSRIEHCMFMYSGGALAATIAHWAIEAVCRRRKDALSPSVSSVASGSAPKNSV
jgi:hypothetical protein